MRVKRSATTHQRHKKVLKAAKGMQHNRRRSFRLAKQGVTRALEYAYRDRRNKKRDLRRLWITRINAASREHGISYGRFMSGLKRQKVELDRKILSELAVKQPEVITLLVKVATKS